MNLVERVERMDPLTRVVVARRETLRFPHEASLADLVCERPRARRRTASSLLPHVIDADGSEVMS